MYIFFIFFYKYLILSIKLYQTNALIEQQPIFTSQPVDVGPLFSGTRGILQCTASGTPTVQYKWLKNGQSLTNKSSTNGGVYLISQADRYKDVGVYQCIAENRLGSVLSNKAYLTVAYMDQLKVQYPVEIRVKSGRAAVIKLPKMYEAYPAPTVEWFAGGALIEPNAKFAITKDFNLVVLRCDKADEKSYYVEVSSIHTGTRIRSREIRLYVNDNSFIDEDENNYENGFNNNQDNYLGSEYSNQDDSNIDLEFVVKPSDTIAKLNDNLVKFDCIVNSRKQALDQLEINWYKDQQLIDFIKTKYHLSSRSLEIISVTDQDAGVYTCSAKYVSIPNGYNSDYIHNNVVSINASAKLDVYIKPTFKTQPESLIETDFGKTVQLKCDGISNPPANITWYKNAELIDFEKQTNIQQADSGTRLIINNISIKDQAIYQCFLSNEAGHISASTLIKIISFAPKFTDQIHNRTVYSDSNIDISCGKVDGSPKPKITWTRVDSFSETVESSEQQLNEDFQNEYQETNEQGLNKYQMNGDLSIRNVNPKHEGWYKCEANNILGKISASMYLQVKKKTEIIEPPMNISVTKGQSALFKCTVSKEDDTDIELQWKFNDLTLDLTPQTNSYDFNYNQDGNSNLKLYKNGTLQIIEAKNTDIGTYKCIVTSLNNAQAGNDSKTAYLNVVELPYAPVNLNANLNQYEKRSINLTWQSSFDGNNPILKYIVHAKINSFDQSLIQYDQTSSMYDWFVIKDNVIINQNFFQYQQQQQQQQLQTQTTHWTIINDLKPAYIYEFRVSAVNGIGEGMPSRPSNNITIPEEAPSFAPLNIQAYSINSKTINLQWQHPPVSSWNGRLKGYQIAYSLSYPNSTWKYLQIDDYSQTNANLTDLIVWETYLIKICAFNSKGYGKYSNPPIRIRTKEGIPIRPPLNFKADSVNSTCIKMSWNEPPPQFVNGLIQGYKLQFYENNQTDLKQARVIYINQSMSNSAMLSSQSTQFNYQMCNLSKFTLYTLGILCFTSSGDGPLTQPIQLKTLEDVPGEVSDILFNNVYDTSVDIEWRPPLQPNGRILSYIISYKPAQNTSKFEHIILDSSQFNFTIRNLKSSTDYIIGLRAKTQAGDGVQKLLQIKSGVPPELPEPPKAIVLRTIGQTSVELEFIPGYNGKTSINKWIVEALIVFDSKYNGSKWHFVYEKSNAPNATKLVVDNLKPFTNYSLRMYSKNVKGISKPSQPTEIFQTLADVPSYTPEYLSARLENLYINTTRANNVNALIKWTPIPTSKWNGIPLGYMLFINECFSNVTNKIEIKFNKFKQTSYLLKDLGAFKCYKIGISAWNSVGLGPKTDESNLLILNRTSQSRPSNYTYNVNLYTINSTAIRVSWSKLDNLYSNGILTGYMIKYQPVDMIQKNDSSKDIISYYDYDDSTSDSNNDNDLIYLSNYKSKETFFRLSLINENDLRYETILNDLLSFTTYKIEISACTRAGCGQSSLPVSIKTLEYIPSRPIDLNFPYVNLTSVKLEWKSPRYPNGFLSSFRIRYILKRNLYPTTPFNAWSYLYLNLNKTNLNKNIYEIEINDLMKMEYYIFEISANNTSKMGWGETAKTIVYTIDNLSRLRPDGPSKPTISKSSIKSNELTISWNTNSDNYSPIRYFTIQLAEFINETDSLNHNDSIWRTIYLYKCSNSNLNNNYRLTIKGKDKLNRLIIKPNGVYYKFRIASTNDIGTSEFSSESNLVKTKQDLPKLNLFNLNAKPIDSNTISLDWFETKNDDNLTKFKIIYRLIQDDSESLMSNELIIDVKNTSKLYKEIEDINEALNELREDETNENLNFLNKNSIYHRFDLKTNNLDRFGKYEFEICGINYVGQAQKCVRTKTLLYAEDRLPFFDKSILTSIKSLSSTEINVTWSRPNDYLINGKLYAYKLVLINNDYLDTFKISKYLNNKSEDTESILEDLNDDFINIVIVEPDLNSIILNNLKPYKNYTILIQLVNQAGESQLPTNKIDLFDPKMRAQTFESIPSEPAKIQFSYVGYSHLNLTFFRPYEPNGIILAYELWYENMPTQSLTTRIIRQEITTNLDSSNQTLYISNLEPMINYKFKVRCKTNIDWGPYKEKIVFTGPQLKKNYRNDIEENFREAPLAPSKPVYTNLNETHSLLEWKSYSNDYESFIVEIKFISLSDSSNQVNTGTNNITKNEFELFQYSNTSSLYISKFDKKLGQHLASRIQQQNYLCLFRVFSLNSISISEPSPNSELIHINKLTSQSLASINKDFGSNQQLFYLNWWFLVIIALSSVTILIIVILIMLLRGKNKKFLQKKVQKEQIQQKMNTIKLMKLNNNQSNANPDMSNDDSDNMNTNSIYLAGSNQQLILTNTTNTLSRGNYGSNNNQITLYEIRKSKRGSQSNNYNTGTIKTATYVSPNGTLSRINIISDQNSMDVTDNSQLTGTLLKQQQLNGIANPRTLSNLIGLSNGMAQPNDYTTSKVGAILINSNENGTIKSTLSSKNNHYLMPLNKSDSDENNVDAKQHLYFQHMGPNYGQLQGNTNVNFNYSSSDNENEPNTSNFNHMTQNYMSKRQVYTTNSFGRQALNSNTTNNTQNIPNNLPPPPPSLLTSSLIQTETDSTGFNVDRRVNYNYTSTKSKAKTTNTYLDHQQILQMQQQPMYHTHQGTLIEDMSSPPPAPPPPPPPPPMPAISSNLRLSSKSPYIVKKPPINQPIPPRPPTSTIKSAASSTVDAISALASAAINPQSSMTANSRTNFKKLNENSYSVNNYIPVNNNLKTINSNSNANQNQIDVKNDLNETSNSSFNLSGDRVVMNNVAGSRKPLAGGYSFF